MLLIGYFLKNKNKNVTPNSSPPTLYPHLVICLIKLAIFHNYYRIYMCYGEWYVWLVVGKWIFKKVDGLVVKMMKGWRGYGIRYKCGKPLFAMVVFSFFKMGFFVFVFFFQSCNGAWLGEGLRFFFIFFFPNNIPHNSFYVISATKIQHATATHLMCFIMPWVLYYLKFRN